MSTRILTLSPERYHALHGRGQAATLIDVRTPAEYRAGHAAGALLLPLDERDPGKLEECRIDRRRRDPLVRHGEAASPHALE